MKIKAIALDVDGTLTDGKLYVSNSGEDMKTFSVKDGMAIVGAINLGIKIFIITGKKSEIVKKRAEELGITDIYQGIHNKVEVLKILCQKYSLTPDNIAYMGDDLNDYGAVQFSGFSGAPKDSAGEIIKIVDFISNHNGGDGAVREFIEYILNEAKLWIKIVDKFKNQN
ncbi:MAG: KdsC family phosphatase [Fusobacteriaceae bacterium]